MSSGRLVSPERETEIVKVVSEGGRPSGTYFVLLVLSTLIASFGLVSNSTATVIGAMIVAPLMGPILALALGLVRGDPDLVRRATAAEVLGVLAVLATSMLLALLLGPSNLDYGVAEIQGRTRPTLYDMGIGFAAGMAGGFAVVNRKISASIAGVAIAVALVPPLSACGLMLGGWLRDEVRLGLAFQPFALFLANFVTIELAAGLVFAISGLGRLGKVFEHRALARGLWLNLLLLAGLGIFLSVQLRDLVDERFYRQATREFLAEEIPRMVPGGSLEDLLVELRGARLVVRVATRAPQPVSPAMAGEIAAGLRARLELGRDQDLDLLVGTGLYEYVSPTGRQFVQEAPSPPPELQANERLDRALREALGLYPGAELVQWNRPARERVHLAVRSPYVFDEYRVDELQRQVREKLGREGADLQLTVRTTLGRDYTSRGPVESPVEVPRNPGDQVAEARRDRVRQLLEARVAAVEQASLLGVEVQESAESGPAGAISPSPVTSDSPLPPPTPVFPGASLPLLISARIQSPRPLPRARVESWRSDLQRELDTVVRLKVDNPLGATLEAAPGPSPQPSPSPEVVRRRQAVP